MPRSLSLLAVFVLAAPLTAADAPKQPLRDYVEKTKGRFAYGLYFKDKKAGWMVEELKLATVNGKEVAVHTSEAYLSIVFMGEKSIMSETAVTHYELEGEGGIVFGEERKKEGGQKEELWTAVRKGNEIVLTRRSGGRTTERKVPASKDTLAQHRRFEQWLKGDRKKGDTFEHYSASWDEEDVDVKEVVTFRERKTILWAGVKTEVVSVKMASQGAEFEALVQDDGTPVTGSIGGFIEIKMEPEKLARQLGDGEVDLLAASAVYVDKDLGDAEEVVKLTLEATGVGDFKFPESHRQKVTRKGEDGVVLELSRDFRAEKEEPLTPEQRKNYLRATPSLQTDDPAIKEVVKKAVGDETDPVKVATKLHDWVYKRLRKTSAANAENALAVLENKAGDCTEHSLLFVALARAAGVPAREVGGLAYVGGKKPLFGWHAWAEVHDGKQWVTVDPTWHEVYVDATHIKFADARDDLAWVNVAGKLKLKVVSYETKK